MMNNQKIQPLAPPPRSKTIPIIDRLVLIYKMWQEFVIHIPKKSRYSLGHKIDLYLLTVIELVYSASISGSTEKLILLRQALRKFDVLKFLARIAWEIKALDNKKYLALSEPFDEIGRMLGGWLKKTAKETPAQKFNEFFVSVKLPK